ncbi:hypothetical protein PIB30_053607 [Stylosanthes scabra]|uniref:Uncharacterized protein n=1 Tax=Stylosanthes scabra TaxID=79078 RepID=A0ABU6QIH8_9FABA|nr:hypothetical protein [Stylosanthes scabra]
MESLPAPATIAACATIRRRSHLHGRSSSHLRRDNNICQQPPTSSTLYSLFSNFVLLLLFCLYQRLQINDPAEEKRDPRLHPARPELDPCLTHTHSRRDLAVDFVPRSTDQTPQPASCFAPVPNPHATQTRLGFSSVDPCIDRAADVSAPSNPVLTRSSGTANVCC